MIGRILAVDPGEKRIGVAISDETGTLARGLTVINHTSLRSDCGAIAEMVRNNDVKRIIVGCSYGSEGESTPQTRHAQKVAEALIDLTGLQVDLWDEHGSTAQARAIRFESGAKRKDRGGHLDEVAAALILQNWMDANHDHEI